MQMFLDILGKVLSLLVALPMLADSCSRRWASCCNSNICESRDQCRKRLYYDRSRFFSCHCGGSRFVHNQLYSFFYLLGGHICLYVWLVDGNYISSLHWESLYAKLIESRDGVSVCGGSEVWQRVLAAGGNVRLKRYSTFIKMSLYIPNSCCRI